MRALGGGQRAARASLGRASLGGWALAAMMYFKVSTAEYRELMRGILLFSLYLLTDLLVEIYGNGT